MTTNSVGTYIVPTATFEVTMPAQPAFSAYVSPTFANVTGNGGVYRICNDNNNTIFDQNADYDDDGTFTAPVTGRYVAKCYCTLGDVTAAATDCVVQIVTSNATYFCGYKNPGAVRTASGYFGTEAFSFADMDAADTAVFEVEVNGEAGDVNDLISTAEVLNYIQMFLAC